MCFILSIFINVLQKFLSIMSFSILKSFYNLHFHKNAIFTTFAAFYRIFYQFCQKWFWKYYSWCFQFFEIVFSQLGNILTIIFSSYCFIDLLKYDIIKFFNSVSRDSCFFFGVVLFSVKNAQQEYEKGSVSQEKTSK